MMTLRSGPRLLTARLMRRNEVARSHVGRSHTVRWRWRWRGWRLALYGVCALVLVLGWSFDGALGSALIWLRQNIVIASTFVAFCTLTLVARHRTATRADFAKSWLAALPVRRGIARREAFLLEVFPVLVGLATLTVMLVLIELALIGDLQNAARNSAVVDWLWLAGAIILGGAASYAVPAPKIIVLPPGSRYVPKTQSQRGRPVQPTFSALGQWPVRKMFARAQPKVVARSLVPVLLSIGLQSTADVAMVAVGIFASVAAITLLVPSVIQVSGAAARWLLPLPVASRPLLAAVVGRSLVWVVAFGALAGFLFTLMDASNAMAIKAAVVISFGGVAAVLLGVALRGRIGKP
jgi:hypothetical protein